MSRRLLQLDLAVRLSLFSLLLLLSLSPSAFAQTSPATGVRVNAALQAPVITLLNPTSGNIGDTVTITGSNFSTVQATSTVSFSPGVLATASAWSNSSITVTVPNGAATGNVVVTVAGQASNGSAFTVTSASFSCTPPTNTTKIASDKDSIQAWINSATNGSYGCVAATSSTWNGTVTFPRGKEVSVIGASLWGGGTTTITNATIAFNCDGCTCPGPSSRFGGFTINNAASGNEFLFSYCSQDMRFDHNNVAYTTAGEYMTFWGYNNSTGTSANWYEGDVTGVIDHNNFTYVRAVIRGGAGGPAGGKGNDRWFEPLNFGTAHMLYFEDNTFTYLDASQGGFLNTFDGNQGCGYSARFNNINNGRIEFHSLQGDNDRGCKKWESMYNNWTNVSTPSGAPHSFRQWLFRGGTGTAHHETSDGLAQNREINIDNDRSHECSISSGQHGCPVVPNGQQQVTAWGMAGWDVGGEQPNGNSFIDGNTPGGRGYPARDQIGRATDITHWANNFPNPAPAQSFQPVYIFRNIDPFGEVPITINCENSGIPCSHQTTYHIVQNRDYYLYNAACSGASCTSGVGEGTALPTTCTAGTGFWKTNEGTWRAGFAGTSGKMYVCGPTNIWTPNYIGNTSGEPYTYPHPRTAR